jgi:hypothetical protein
MPAIIGLFLRALAWALPGLGWSLLKGLGFGAVTFTGVSLAMDQAKGYVFSSLGALPTAWLQLLGVLQIDVYFNILFSAYVARAVLWGMNKSGSKSSMRWLGK